MPILYAVGGNVVALFVMLFIVYWCYGTQLSVNGATAADFWGTKNAGINYGMLFTAWGVAGLLGARIGGKLFDKYHNYQMAFYTAAVLAAVALLCELVAKRPAVPEEGWPRGRRRQHNFPRRAAPRRRARAWERSISDFLAMRQSQIQKS